MFGLDTNVLIRSLVTGDDPEQSRRARDYIACNCSAENPAFVDAVVLCETVWVLSRPLRYGRGMVLDVVERLIHQRFVHVESQELAMKAITLCRSSNLDFADAFIGLRNQKVNANPTATFDRRAAKHALFTLI